MNDTLDTHIGTVNIGGRIITNLRFADEIFGLAGSESELNSLISQLDFTSRASRLEINATKTQIMTNFEGKFISEIKINNKPLNFVDTFKYLGEIIDDKGSTTEINARTREAMAD